MKRYEECSCCGYMYTSENEEPDYEADNNTQGKNAPVNWDCPICGHCHEPCKENHEGPLS